MSNPRLQGVNPVQLYDQDSTLSTAEYQRDLGQGRNLVLKDIEELDRLRRDGGPALSAARDLQRQAAAGQQSIARGMDRGGRGGRMGSMAAKDAEVGEAPAVALVKEAETQGYTRAQGAALALVAISDQDFDVAMRRIRAGMSQEKEAEASGKKTATYQGMGTGAAIGSLFSPAGALLGAGIGAGAGYLMANEGGVVPGDPGVNRDVRPAMLTPGEIVIPKELSAKLMEVMSRSVGGGDVVRAQTGGVVRRDPQTGYLVEDQNAMALQKLATLAPPAMPRPVYDAPIPLAPPAMPQPVYDAPRRKSAAERAWDKGTSAGGWVLLPNSPDERGLYHYGHRKTGEMAADKRPPEEFFKATEKSGKGRK